MTFRSGLRPLVDKLNKAISDAVRTEPRGDRVLGFDGSEYKWATMITDGMPEHLRAQYGVVASEGPCSLGGHMSVRVFAMVYDGRNRAHNVTQLYLSEFLQEETSDEEFIGFAECLKTALERARNDIPKLVEKLPQVVAERDEIWHKLQESGLVRQD